MAGECGVTTSTQPGAEAGHFVPGKVRATGLGATVRAGDDVEIAEVVGGVVDAAALVVVGEVVDVVDVVAIVEEGVDVDGVLSVVEV